jgi:tetratricopeptide (TPR) repeat protein
MTTWGERHAGMRAALLTIYALAILSAAALSAQDEYDRSALVAVPVPAIDRLEKPIQEQLAEQRAVLEELLSKPDTARLDLMRGYGGMGQLYFLYELWAPAEVCFDNALALAPRDFRWHYYLGVMYSRQGEADKAVTALDKAVELRPESVPARIRLGRLKFEQGETEAAEEQFLEVLEVDAGQAAAYNELGRIAQQRGEVEKAIELYQKALALQPEADSIHLQLGMAYRDAGNMDKAREHMRLNKQGPVIFPDPLVYGLTALTRSARFYLKLGSERLSEGRLTEAEEAFREAISRDPEDRLAHYNLGLTLLRMERREEAVENFERALEIDQDNRDAHFNLATVMAEEGRFREAATHFHRAYEIDPQDREAHLEWAVALSRSGRLAEAAQELEKLLAEEPENAKAHLQMGLLEERDGRPTEAIEQLQIAVEIEPDLLEAHAAAGALFGRRGRFAEAAGSFARVVELDPVDVGARFSLAMALILGEEYRRARKTLEEALMAFPGNLPLSHLLARLLASAPDGTVRDGARAVQLALAAYEEGGTVDQGETVAMAWAEAGDFDQALTWQRRMLGQVEGRESPERVAQLRHRLALYESGQPCRAPWKED